MGCWLDFKADTQSSLLAMECFHQSVIRNNMNKSLVFPLVDLVQEFCLYITGPLNSKLVVKTQSSELNQCQSEVHFNVQNLSRKTWPEFRIFIEDL
jgi:hypothetical protein